LRRHWNALFPGLRFGNPGDKNAHSFIRNPERVAIDHDHTTAGATVSGLRLSQMTSVIPGFKANPGLELANAFSVIHGVANATQLIALLTSYSPRISITQGITETATLRALIPAAGRKETF